MVELYVHSRAEGDAAAWCETVRHLLHGGAHEVLRLQGRRCEVSQDVVEQLAAFHANREEFGNVTLDQSGDPVPIPYRAVEFSFGEPWDKQGGDTEDGIAVHLYYDQGWRVVPYGYVVSGCQEE